MAITERMEHLERQVLILLCVHILIYTAYDNIRALIILNTSYYYILCPDTTLYGAAGADGADGKDGTPGKPGHITECLRILLILNTSYYLLEIILHTSYYIILYFSI
jgi:hypothetical protein